MFEISIKNPDLMTSGVSHSFCRTDNGFHEFTVNRLEKNVLALLFVISGFVNTLLSWKGFIPLSRLTYMAYLVHIIIMDHYLLTYQRTIHLTDSEYVSFYDPQQHI